MHLMRDRFDLGEIDELPSPRQPQVGVDISSQQRRRIASPRTVKLVCAENVIRIHLVTERLNVSADGRAAMFLHDAVGLLVQVEEPILEQRMPRSGIS
jgi:hypothetical protein